MAAAAAAAAANANALTADGNEAGDADLQQQDNAAAQIPTGKIIKVII